MRHKQQGMTLIGWIGTISIVLLLALAAIRLAPVYLQYFRIADVIRDIPLQMQNENNVSPTAIRSYVEKRFDIEAVTVIEAKDAKITRSGDNYVVTVDYDHVVPFLANVNFLVEFDATSTVRR
jgi:hypothetical protein